MSGQVFSRRALLLALGTSALLSGCTTAPHRTWTLGGGEAGGYFGQFARLLAETARETGSGVQLESQVTTGSLENVARILSGELDFGLALADSVADNADELRAVARIYQTYWQLLVPVDSPVLALKDLAGQRVSLGPNGSGTQFTARRILTSAGLSPTSVEEVPLTVTETAIALADRRIDAALVAGGIPLPDIKRILGEQVRLIGLEKEAEKLTGQYGSGYFPVQIPPGTYSNTEPEGSLGVPSLLVCSPHVPAEIAKQVVRLLLQYPDRLVPYETLGTQYLDPRSMIFTAGVPLHEGAAQAFREHHG